MRLEIDNSWTFNEVVEHLKALRDQYRGILASFSWCQSKEYADFICETRNQFYSLDLPEEKLKDMIWNYMNGFEMLYKLKIVAKRYK